MDRTFLSAHVSLSVGGSGWSTQRPNVQQMEPGKDKGHPGEVSF